MYPVCRGRPYCLRCGTERGRLEAARIEVPEGCYRRRDGRVKRAPREEAGWDWVSEGETEREERERERGKKREGGRGEDCRGRVRVMICRVSRSTSDDSDPSSRRVGRETKEGHQESQPGIFFPRPRPRLISFPAFFLFLPSSPSFLFPLFFFYLIREPAITTATRHSCRDTSSSFSLHLSPSPAMGDIPSRTRFSSHCFIPSPKHPSPFGRPNGCVANVVGRFMLNHSRKNCNQSSLRNGDGRKEISKRRTWAIEREMDRKRCRYYSRGHSLNYIESLFELRIYTPRVIFRGKRVSSLEKKKKN